MKMVQQKILLENKQYEIPYSIDQSKVVAAAEKALNKIEKNIDNYKNGFVESGLKYRFSSINQYWTHGMQTGCLWLAYEISGNKIFKDVAEHHFASYRTRFDEKIGMDDHDVGFVFSPSCDCAFDGVYLDQIASFNATLCFDETHPHPLGGGNWWNNSYHKMIRSVRDLLGDEKFITTESCCETYIDVLDLFLVLDTNMQYGALNSLTASGIATSVPLFSMIYGEHALSYGSICRFSDRVDRFEYNLVRNTLWGILPCIEGIDMEQFRNGMEHLAVTKKVVDFFKAHKQTILYGRICEVPKYNCNHLKIDWEGKCEGSRGGRFSYEETYPAVNAVIWQKSDGKKILLAYNFSDEEQTIELNGVCYKILPKSFADFDL